MARPRSDLFWNMPRDWYNEPISDSIRKTYLDFGWIDENGNITPEGKTHRIVKEMLLGTETREHYEEYLKHWNVYAKKFDEWASDERIPWDQQPQFDYVEKWDSEQ